MCLSSNLSACTILIHKEVQRTPKNGWIQRAQYAVQLTGFRTIILQMPACGILDAILSVYDNKRNGGCEGPFLAKWHPQI